MKTEEQRDWHSREKGWGVSRVVEIEEPAKVDKEM